MLRAFGTNTEYIPQCRAILDGSSNPYAQHFAAASLIKLLTENSGLSPQARPCLQPVRTPLTARALRSCGWTCATTR